METTVSVGDERVYDREAILKRLKQPKVMVFVWTAFTSYAHISTSEAAKIVKKAKDAGQKIRLDIPVPLSYHGKQLVRTQMFLTPYREEV